MEPPPPISGIHFLPPPCLEPYYYHPKLQRHITDHFHPQLDGGHCFFFQPLARPSYPWFRIHVLLPPWMKGWGYEEDIVTCHTFHMPCGPNSQAVARLGYFESSSSALILHFCHSLRVCSSYMELSHMTHLTTIKAGARITSVFCSPLVPWDNFKQEQTSTPHEQQKSKTRALEVQESGLQGTWKAWHVTLSSYPQPFIIGVDLRTVFIF